MGTMVNNVLVKAEVQALMESVLEDQHMYGAKMVISSGSEKGDGYLSFLTKVDVTADNKNLHVMIKCAPRAEEFRKMAPIRLCYVREMYMYDAVFPTFKNFQDERNLENSFTSYAKCYKTSPEEGCECLILENIKERGFGLWDRMKYMNDEHISLVFQEYGKLHAISFAMKDQNKDLYDNLTKDMDDVFNKKNVSPEVYEAFTNSADKISSLFCSDTEKPIYEAMVAFNKNIPEFFEFMEENPGEYTAICHGDCWCNNMMFKYSDKLNPGKPTDLCLLDFQISKIGSPVIDLSYFFYVSSPKHILDKLDHYLQIYYKSFISHMRALGSDGEKLYPFSALKNDWKIYGKFGFIMALMVVRAMMREKDEIVDFTDMTAKGASVKEFMHKESRNDVGIAKRLRSLAIHLYENGFL